MSGLRKVRVMTSVECGVNFPEDEGRTPSYPPMSQPYERIIAVAAAEDTNGHTAWLRDNRLAQQSRQPYEYVIQKSEDAWVQTGSLELPDQTAGRLLTLFRMLDLASPEGNLETGGPLDAHRAVRFLATGEVTPSLEANRLAANTMRYGQKVEDLGSLAANTHVVIGGHDSDLQPQVFQSALTVAETDISLIHDFEDPCITVAGWGGSVVLGSLAAQLDYFRTEMSERAPVFANTAAYTWQ